VPRLWVKFQQGVHAKMPPAKLQRLLGIPILGRIVRKKVLTAIGLQECEFAAGGAAPMPPELLRWYNRLGLDLVEVYGMTENAAGATVNHPDDYKMGTVGPALPGSEVKLGEGDEILLRGPHIMEGYHNLPEETAKALTEDGWLHTGDKGTIDADGFLTITGRIKDLFKTSGGKYIAPSSIESKFKALCPYASQFVVFGDEKNFVVALITLDEDAMKAWAAENDMADKSYSEIVGSDQVRTMVGGYVDELNAKLNRWETIKKWELLDHDLSVESGELTPSMKVKRNVVEANNKARIDAFYTG
jgi:long-chain acyl-CoA synthetase